MMRWDEDIQLQIKCDCMSDLRQDVENILLRVLCNHEISKTIKKNIIQIHNKDECARMSTIILRKLRFTVTATF